MKEGLPNDLVGLDENDPVWRLLAQAPRPEPDGWFAARAMARCRQDRKGIVVGRIWRWALGGGLGLALAMVFAVAQVDTEKADDQKKVQEAFEIMASIDTDPDSSSSNSSWQDTSL